MREVKEDLRICLGDEAILENGSRMWSDLHEHTQTRWGAARGPRRAGESFSEGLVAQPGR